MSGTNAKKKRKSEDHTMETSEENSDIVTDNLWKTSKRRKLVARK